MIEYISGDTITQRATLYIDVDNNVPLVISNDHVLNAYIVDYKRNKMVVENGIVNVIDADNGVIEVLFNSTQTESLKSYDGDILWLAVTLSLGINKITFKQRFKAVKMLF